MRPCAGAVARLRCLRGIDTLSALGLCAEIGEWERFDHPDQLSAYDYRRGPAVGEALERRQRGQSPEVINVSWRAQRRLNARWRQLKDARKKPNGIVAVAIARELACWEITTCTISSDPVTVTPTTRRRLTNSR